MSCLQSVFNRWRRHLAILCALTVALVASGTVHAAIFNAVSDFSNTVNTDTSMWSYRWSDDQNRDGSYTLLPTNDFAVQFNPPNQTWNIGNSAFVGVNQSGGPISTVTHVPGFTVPNNSIIMSPAGLVVVSWLSPVSGLVNIQFSFTDLEVPFSEVDMARYFVDRNDASGQLAGGTLPELGTTGVMTLNNVVVSVGDRINFVVDRIGFNSGDSIAFTATITEVTAPVPEPTSVLLWAAGALGIAFMGARRLSRPRVPSGAVCRAGHS